MKKTFLDNIKNVLSFIGAFAFVLLGFKYIKRENENKRLKKESLEKDLEIETNEAKKEFDNTSLDDLIKHHNDAINNRGENEG